MTTIVPNWAVTEVIPSPNFTPGREVPIKGIVLHHYGVDGVSHDGAIRTLTSRNAGGKVSAHYAVSAGRVTQLVSDRDVAWHCYGNNAGTIGIECKPEMSAGDFETAARLIAAIRSEHGPLPLSGHRDHFATACPGRYYPRLGELSARADAILASGGQAAPAPAPATVSAGIVDVDGWVGIQTNAALQRILGTPIDGEVWGQWAGNREYLPAVSSGWYFSVDATGSPMIRALQKALGVTADGVIGPETIRAWQARLGVPVDGYLGTTTGRAIQTAINTGKAF